MKLIFIVKDADYMPYMMAYICISKDKITCLNSISYFKNLVQSKSSNLSVTGTKTLFPDSAESYWCSRRRAVFLVLLKVVKAFPEKEELCTERLYIKHYMCLTWLFKHGYMQHVELCVLQAKQSLAGLDCSTSWVGWDSNPGPLTYSGSTLPTELPSHLVRNDIFPLLN